MFGKLIGRSSEPKKKKKDKAIIHRSVPDEVLYPEGRKEEQADTSWMNDVLPARSKDAERDASEVSPRREATGSARPAPRQASRSDAAPATRPAPPVAMPEGDANAETSGRPRFPVGWLVIVEGPGTGDWFPLEKGLSTLGDGEGRTIPLGEGDAAIAFDPDENLFSIDGKGVRLNGVRLDQAARLRDGDVIALGGVTLKLVALCSGNFRWT